MLACYRTAGMDHQCLNRRRGGKSEGKCRAVRKNGHGGNNRNNSSHHWRIISFFLALIAQLLRNADGKFGFAGISPLMVNGPQNAEQPRVILIHGLE